MKRIISCIVITIYLLTAAGLTTGAVGKGEPQTASGALEELRELGLVQGDENGDLRAEAFLSRAEFAALLSRTLKLAPADSATAFDVPAAHWACGAVGAVTEKGFMSGDPDGGFRPDDVILYEEAAKTFVQILGYEAQAEEYGGYPWGTLLTAAELGIIRGADGAAGQKMTRGTLGQIMLNSLYIVPHENAEISDLLIAISCPEVFFVSPEGSDEGDGSFLHPWRSLRKAAETLRPGQSAIFEDGVYAEESPLRLSGDGRENITLRGRNPQMASVVFPESEGACIEISAGYEGLSLKNFDFMQNAHPVIVENTAHGVSICGNAFGGTVAIRGAQDVQLMGNSFDGAGITVTEAKAAEIRGNTFYNAVDAAIRVTDGSSDGRISNNKILANEQSVQSGILLDGSSNFALWNNVIAATGAGEIASGLLLRGVSRGVVFNNVFSGAKVGLEFAGAETGGKAGSVTTDITMRNNIISGTAGSAYIFTAMPERVSSDYNLFYEAYPEYMETNSLFGFPEFINSNNDWRIITKSPGAYSGADVPDVLNGSSGEIYALDMTDMNGVPADGRLSMGAYRYVADPKEQTGTAGGFDSLPRFQPGGAELLFEDFKDEAAPNWVPKAGTWFVEDGVLKQVMASAGRAFMVYDKGFGWTDVAISADVRSPVGDASNVGISFRQSADARNAYVFRFIADNSVQFGKWVDGKFSAVEQWKFPYEYDTAYNLGVEARGSQFKLYVNGKLIAEIKDDSHAVGTVAPYSFQQESVFDNIKVTVAE